MTAEADILKSFRKRVADTVSITPAGLDRYVVSTPFMFDDGDHFVVILRRESPNGWTLTDEGHTFMHLSYTGIDIEKGTRAKVIDHTLGAHSVVNVGGELRLAVPRAAFGDALFSFVQAITQIAGTALWTRERVDVAFHEQVREVLDTAVPQGGLLPDYYDPSIDPDGIYRADYLVEGGAKPHLVFVVSTEHRCQQATITCHHFERKQRRVGSVVLFEDQTKISRRLVAQLSNVVGKQFAYLEPDRVRKYFTEEVLGRNGSSNGH